MKTAIVVACLVLFCGSVTAGPYKAGARVLAQYGGGDTWYVGKVVAQKGRKVDIAYLDGSKETISDGHVRAFDWKDGTKVSCKFKGGENWYPGTVVAVKGDKVSINYDDGDKEDINLRFCREPASK